MSKLANPKFLANWYFGNFCAKCGNIGKDDKNYGKDCWDKLHAIAEKIGDNEMSYKEFVYLIKANSTFCKPTKRKFHECALCKKLGWK